MKKIMLIGKTGSGKTSLTQMLNNELVGYKKTQSMEFCSNIIDTPGEYIEIKGYYRALIVTATECDLIGFVQDATESETLFPPNFAAVLNKPAIGIITKTDLVDDCEHAKELLEIAGVHEFICTTTKDNKSVEIIRKILGG